VLRGLDALGQGPGPGLPGGLQQVGDHAAYLGGGLVVDDHAAIQLHDVGMQAFDALAVRVGDARVVDQQQTAKGIGVLPGAAGAARLGFLVQFKPPHQPRIQVVPGRGERFDGRSGGVERDKVAVGQLPAGLQDSPDGFKFQVDEPALGAGLTEMLLRAAAVVESGQSLETQ